MAVYFFKSVPAVLDYTIDWSEWLEMGDTIATSSWSVPAGITDVIDSKTTTTTTIKVAAGVLGMQYQLINTITTVAGLTDTRTIVLTIISGE